MPLKPVPPRSLDVAIDYVRKGGRLIVPSYTRTIVIDKKCLARFEAAGQWLLKEEGDGYRLRSGKGSVYVFSGQLKFEEATR
jgi:hypothetical protein